MQKHKRLLHFYASDGKDKTIKTKTEADRQTGRQKDRQTDRQRECRNFRKSGKL